MRVYSDSLRLGVVWQSGFEGLDYADIIHTQTNLVLVWQPIIAAMLKLTFAVPPQCYVKKIHIILQKEKCSSSHVAISANWSSCSESSKIKLIEYGVLQEVRDSNRSRSTCVEVVY